MKVEAIRIDPLETLEGRRRARATVEVVFDAGEAPPHLVRRLEEAFADTAAPAQPPPASNPFEPATPPHHDETLKMQALALGWQMAQAATGPPCGSLDDLWTVATGWAQIAYTKATGRAW